MMALNVAARPMANGYASPSQAEDENLYEQLLRVRDAVLSNEHPQFKLSAAAIERLKALADADTLAAGSDQRATTSDMHEMPSYTSNSNAANLTQLPPSSTAATSSSALPGLHASMPTNNTARSQPTAQFNPLFLEKADSLVRAEAMIKRRNLETELRAQVDRKNISRDRDTGLDMPSSHDVTNILSTALTRVGHVSGLQPVARPESAASSSFDEKDYYSSQVESEWSSPASASKVSDRAANASRAAAGQTDAFAVQSKNTTQQAYSNQPQDALEVEDGDDEYTPPDASAFDVFDDNSALMDITQDTPPEDDDDSEYEPGEITQDSNAPTPYQSQQAAQFSPRVPIIRNHLTHLAAPQPNRVSPLAVAKGPNIELELINGRPEVVHKTRSMQNMPSRASTASPPDGTMGSGKKRRNKKRKRDSEPSSKSKKKRDRNGAAISPPSPMYREPRIKDEPISPPPFGQVANIPEYQPRPAHLDLSSPRYAQVQYVEQPQSALRYEYAQPAPTVVRVASPAAYGRPAQRDNQDLRRVASLHYAQRPQSPVYSPASQRTVSMTYGDSHMSRASIAPVEVRAPQYQDQLPTQYVHAEQYRSSPQTQQYIDPYGRVHSPAMMPPPAAPPRRVVVDQHGNRYYAGEPAPAPAPVIATRASVAPADLGYERPHSRMTSGYGQPLPNSPYDPADPRMGPPPPTPSRRQTSEVQYVDAHGYPIQQYAPRPVEQVRYIEAPTSPVYQSSPRYEQMPPPAPPAPTSPVYAPPPRSYSVRPEETAPAPVAYSRQASVAPIQYGRPEASVAPVRAMSVMPGYDHGAIALPRAYSQAPQPQPVQYLDAAGQEVYSSDIQQAPQQYRYRVKRR